MSIHPEGKSTIIKVFLVAAIISICLGLFAPPIFVLIGAPAFTILLLFIIFFFRHPKRIVGPSNDVAVSPADGRVIFIDDVFENEYFKKKMKKISIFMSIYDVHLNRAPIDGEVVYQKYHPGKYLLAMNPKSSELNERNTVVIKNLQGQELLVRQIAGGVARRIKKYLKTGQTVIRGEELGFIRFGSRVDFFLPMSAEIKVKIDEKVKGNISIIANLKIH